MLTMLLGLSLLAAPVPQSAAEWFTAGRALLKEGRHLEARRHFEMAQRLEPSLGGLLNLGECEDKLDRPVEAWRYFTAAADWATRQGEDDRRRFALERLAALERRLARVTLTAPDAQVTLEVNGSRVASRERTVVRAGTVELRASQPGHRPWVVQREASAGALLELEVPALALDAAPQPVVVQAPTPPAPYLGIALGGSALAIAGAVGIGVGVATKLEWDAQQIPGSPATVTRAQADTAQALFVSGIAAATIGVGVAITAGVLGARAERPRLSVVPLAEGLMLSFGGSL